MKPKDHKKPLPPTIREKAAKRKAAKDRRKERCEPARGGGEGLAWNVFKDSRRIVVANANF